MKSYYKSGDCLMNKQIEMFVKTLIHLGLIRSFQEARGLGYAAMVHVAAIRAERKKELGHRCGCSGYRIRMPYR